MRTVVYDSDVCDRMKTHTGVIFQNLAINGISENVAWAFFFIGQNDNRTLLPQNTYVNLCQVVSSTNKLVNSFTEIFYANKPRPALM